MPGTAKFLQIVVADAGLPRAERPSGDTLPFGTRSVGGQLDTDRPLPIGPGGCDTLEKFGPRPFERDRCRRKIADEDGRLETQRNNIAYRHRAHDRFVW